MILNPSKNHCAFDKASQVKNNASSNTAPAEKGEDRYWSCVVMKCSHVLLGEVRLKAVAEKARAPLIFLPCVSPHTILFSAIAGLSGSFSKSGGVRSSATL